MKNIENWQEWLLKESKKPYMKRLGNNLSEEYKNYIIYPEDPFRIFELSSLKDVKVVMIGDSPYYKPLQANGIAFSAEYGLPSVLLNIYRKIEDELKITCDKENGDLTRWVKQGVFLLNIHLTTRSNVFRSHCHLGWDNFTGEVIKLLFLDSKPKVFILLGNEPTRVFRLATKGYINTNHLVLYGEHPNTRVFFKSRFFINTNAFIKEHYGKEIDWT